MIIRKLRASFGALSKSELTLNGGLNVIEAPNESGKSTWCSFIRVMLYGLNTSDRDRSGYISDKTHYRPWNGGAMEGEMDVSLGGRILTLRRTGTASAPMRRFSAFYPDTGDEYQVSGTDIGESLTGVSENVFRRTAFIGQSGIRVDNAYELEKKIASIVASGDEQTSRAEAEERLKSWKNSLRHNKTGLLPRLEEEKRQAEEKYSALSRGFESLSDARDEVERLEKVREQLREDLKKLEIFEVRDEAKRVLDAKRAMTLAENRLKDAEKEAENFKEATPERRDEIKAAAAALAAVAPVYVSAKEEHEKALEKVEKAKTAESGNEFSAVTVKEAEELADRAKKLEDQARTAEDDAQKRAKSYKNAVICLGAVTAALLIAAIVLLIVLPGANPLYFIPAVVLLAVTVIFAAAKKPKADGGAKAELSEILEKYGFSGANEAALKAEEYKNLVRCRESAENALKAAEASRENAEKLAREGQARLDGAVSAAFPGTAVGEGLQAAIRSAERAETELSAAAAEAASAREVYAALSDAYDGDPESVDFSFMTRPMRNRADTTAALSRAEGQLYEAKARLDRSTGEMSALGAPEVVSGEIERLSGEIEEAQEKYEALELARTLIDEADGEMRTRFSPVISRRAGEILGSLTGGRYEKLTFDSAFNAEMRTAGEVVGHSALFASSGTGDQIYLALRLSMCEMLLPGGECPVILDDALANFDDERAGFALETLRETARSRQVIMFTCHSREAKMLAAAPDVNIIKL